MNRSRSRSLSRSDSKASEQKTLSRKSSRVSDHSVGSSQKIESKKESKKQPGALDRARSREPSIARNSENVDYMLRIELRLQELARDGLVRAIKPYNQNRDFWEIMGPDGELSSLMLGPTPLPPLRQFFSAFWYTDMLQHEAKAEALTIANAVRLVVRNTAAVQDSEVLLRHRFWWTKDGSDIFEQPTELSPGCYGIPFYEVLDAYSEFCAPCSDPEKLKVLICHTAGVKDLNFHLNLGSEHRSSKDQCAICLEELDQNGPAVVKSVNCPHFFHEYCLAEHLKYKQDCPLCRRPLTEMETQCANGIQASYICFLHMGSKFRILYSMNPITSLEYCITKLYPDWIDEGEFKTFFTNFLKICNSPSQKEAAAAATKIYKTKVGSYKDAFMARERDLSVDLVELDANDFMSSFDEVLAEARRIPMLVRGQMLEARGLKNAQFLNGKLCLAVPEEQQPKTEERIKVQFVPSQGLTPAEEHKKYELKPENLVRRNDESCAPRHVHIARQMRGASRSPRGAERSHTALASLATGSQSVIGDSPKIQSPTRDQKPPWSSRPTVSRMSREDGPYPRNPGAAGRGVSKESRGSKSSHRKTRRSHSIASSSSLTPPSSSPERSRSRSPSVSPPQSSIGTPPPRPGSKKKQKEKKNFQQGASRDLQRLISGGDDNIESELDDESMVTTSSRASSVRHAR
eukprot:gene591-1010_t